MGSARDRHQRGLRGRLALPNPYTGAPAPLRGRQNKAEYFTMCVHDALTQISDHCPRALAGIDIGVEDVPGVIPAWAPNRVPLAAAVSATPNTNGTVVVYRRPLERRARTRRGLRILVFRTIVEQLSEATGIAVDEIDPLGHRGSEDDWDD
ncbi:metallopeptidase family protein [Propioniciclava soli]|uniref:metallopeptidase family protein n=1 Tax=Propioniciclava soli TaxID=2775081 RepID=UPI001E37ECD7|nr:metallopeptidase family protein [Propioniciclava soli]